MRLVSRAGLGLIACCLAMSPARAGGQNTVSDGPGFEVDLTAPDVTTCFVFPKERVNPQACAGADMSAVEAQIASFRDRSNLVAVAVLRKGKAETMLVVMRVPTEMGRVSAGEVEQTSRGVLKGMSEAAADRKVMEPTLARPARLLQLGDLQVLHMSLVVPLSKEVQELSFLADHYFVLTEGSTRVLQFTTASTDMPLMQPVMERLAQGVRGRPTQKRTSPGSDDAAYRAGYIFGLVGLPVILVVAAFATAYLIARRGKQRPAPERPAEPS